MTKTSDALTEALAQPGDLAVCLRLTSASMHQQLGRRAEISF